MRIGLFASMIINYSIQNIKWLLSYIQENIEWKYIHEWMVCSKTDCYDKIEKWL